MEELIYYMAMHMSKGLSLKEKHELIGWYAGDMGAIFEEESFFQKGIRNLESFKRERSVVLEKAKVELEKSEKLGIGVMHMGERMYPRNLKLIEDYPLIMYYQGEPKEDDMNAIGVVGTRAASGYGLRNSYDLGYQLGRMGMTVVSGLAKGIDKEAHMGALSGGGRTVGVLGNGIGRVYPREHWGLYERIIGEGGCIYSELEIGYPPRRWTFPVRNRIIAGLSIGVVIVEGSKSSGSLHTARFALEYGREVYAYPGPVWDKNYGGAHDLIKSGAKLVEGVEDIVEDLSFIVDLESLKNERDERREEKEKMIQSQRMKREKMRDLQGNIGEEDWNGLKLSLEEEKILGFLEEKKLMEELVEETGLGFQELMKHITNLMVRGLCDEEGGYYQKRRKRNF